MYTTSDRAKLFKQIKDFVNHNPEFEGLIQIGSGALGYADIYSDIDLMAGCFYIEDINSANNKLIDFFENIGAIYIDKRSWSSIVLGVSAYFENGLSVDMSFMPTDEIKIRSPYWNMILSKSEKFTEQVQKSASELKSNTTKIDDSINHRFIYALRKCEIALARSELIFAEISLSEARQILLTIQAAYENKKLHQFKAYNTLDKEFIEQIYKTYPYPLCQKEIENAKELLLSLYLKVVNDCEFLDFDENQLNLLGHFE